MTDPRAVPDASSLDELDCLIVQYATQMTLDVKVNDTVFAAMREQFDTTQIVELTSAIATYNMVARFLVALQITPESSLP